MRFGWASGPKALIDAINVQVCLNAMDAKRAPVYLGKRQTGSSNLQASSVVQILVHALLERWGYDGFETYARNVSNVYKAKRDIFDKALQEHLGDVAEWSTPESGMFFWYVRPCSDCMEPFRIRADGWLNK